MLGQIILCQLHRMMIVQYLYTISTSGNNFVTLPLSKHLLLTSLFLLLNIEKFGIVKTEPSQYADTTKLIQRLSFLTALVWTRQRSKEDTLSYTLGPLTTLD